MEAACRRCSLGGANGIVLDGAIDIFGRLVQHSASMRALDPSAGWKHPKEWAAMQEDFPAAPSSLHVLVVEDERLLRWSIVEELRSQGHLVTEARTAADARAAIGDGAPPIDVVLLDLLLPDSHDLKLLEEFRTRRPGTGVVLMSANISPEQEEHALDLGAYRVVGKPFDMDDVGPLVQGAFAAKLSS